MARPITKFILGFVIVAALVLAAVIIQTASQSAPTSPPLPNPNGYDDLVKASQRLTIREEDYAALSEAELQAAVTNNSEVLKLARLGLSRPCRVPLDGFSTNSSSRVQAFGLFRHLAFAFAAEGRLAELEHRPSEAVAAYSDMLRLGHEVGRGGLIIHALVGIAIESLGNIRLVRLLPELQAPQCRELALALEALESKRQSPAALLEQEHAWTRRTYGLQGQLHRLFQFSGLRQMEKGVVGKIQSQELRTRRLIIDLAARAYELDKGERPKALADLVPAYLKALPQDPLTGTNIVYRP